MSLQATEIAAMKDRAIREAESWLEHDPEHWGIEQAPEGIAALLGAASVLRPYRSDSFPGHRAELDAADAARHLQNAVRALRRMRGLD